MNSFISQNILGGSLQNLIPATDRLVKAKSDGSLASTTITATATDGSFSKMKSRSLEPLTGLAMWSSEPQIIELVKGERGLGFSILDYQVNSKNNDFSNFYPNSSVLLLDPMKSQFSKKNSPNLLQSFYSPSNPYSSIRKSALHDPLRKNVKDQHVRFNFNDQRKLCLSCGVNKRLDEIRSLSPVSPWSGSEFSDTNSPSYTSNEEDSRSPLVSFNYHIYI